MKNNAVDRIKDLLEDVLRDRKILIRIGAVFLILLVAVVLRIQQAGKADLNIETAEAVQTESTAEAGNATSSGDICVDIGGEVVRPGVYTVYEGTRLYQLIELAGGLTALADTNSINQASYVEDGEKIIIPAKSFSSDDAGSSTDNSSAGISADGIVNINLASKDELKTLNGIGDVTADKIIEYRKSNRFRNKEDIKSVKGIGDGIYEKIKDSITC